MKTLDDRAVAPDWRVLSIEEFQSGETRFSRVFENQKFPLNLDNPGAAGEVEISSNWGVGELGIDLEQLKDFPQDGVNVRIGTADTGVDLSHRVFTDLRMEKRLLGFCDFDEEGRGITQIAPSGLEIPESEAEPTFDSWHGTHTAGVLVGRDSEKHWSGLAPGAEIVIARITNSQLSFKAAFSWLGKFQCDIVSLSLGQPGKHEVWAAEIDMLIRSGAVVVAASGNEFIYPGIQTRSPGNYPLPGLISVGALGKDGEVWFKSGGEVFEWPSSIMNAYGESIASYFSGSSKQTVPTLVAPGVDIVSSGPSNSFYSESGTSMATPHIAGLIARVLSILRSKRPDERAAAASNLVIASLSDKGAVGDDERFGLGTISMQRLRELLEVEMS